MKRLARHILDAVTAASLLLFAATLALWWQSTHGPGRSWYVQRIARDDPQYRHLWLYSAGGSLRLHWTKSLTYAPPTWPARWHFDSDVGNSGDGAPIAMARGFGAGAFAEGGYWHQMVVAPCWAAAAAFAALPLMRVGWFVAPRRRARLRRAAGLCPACGYDLRATPTGGRCPECGAPVPQVIP